MPDSLWWALEAPDGPVQPPAEVPGTLTCPSCFTPCTAHSGLWACQDCTELHNGPLAPVNGTTRHHFVYAPSALGKCWACGRDDTDGPHTGTRVSVETFFEKAGLTDVSDI